MGRSGLPGENAGQVERRRTRPQPRHTRFPLSAFGTSKSIAGMIERAAIERVTPARRQSPRPVTSDVDHVASRASRIIFYTMPFT